MRFGFPQFTGKSWVRTRISSRVRLANSSTTTGTEVLTTADLSESFPATDSLPSSLADAPISPDGVSPVEFISPVTPSDPDELNQYHIGSLPDAFLHDGSFSSAEASRLSAHSIPCTVDAHSTADTLALADSLPFFGLPTWDPSFMDTIREMASNRACADAGPKVYPIARRKYHQNSRQDAVTKRELAEHHPRITAKPKASVVSLVCSGSFTTINE